MAELLSLDLESYSALLLSSWAFYLGVTVFQFDVVRLLYGVGAAGRGQWREDVREITGEEIKSYLSRVVCGNSLLLQK